MTTWIRQGARTARFKVRDNASQKLPGRTRFVLAGIGLALLLAGCGKSPEDQLLEAGRCMKAGWLLEDRELSAAAELRQKQVLADMPTPGGPVSLYFARLNERINEELGLHRGRGQAMATLLEWQSSSRCQAMVKELRTTRP